MSNSLKRSHPALAPSELLSQFVQQFLAIEAVPNAASITCGEQLLDLALDLLEGGDFQTRWEVAKLLPQVVSGNLISPQTAIVPLLALLQDEDTEEELAWFAVRILGQIQHADVLATLVETLKTATSEEVRAIAAEVLASQGTQAIAALTQLLSESEWRLLAVRALSQIRHSATIAPLLEVVQDADVQVRVAAIEALSSFHDARVPPVLMAALDDRSALVRREAAVGLGFHPLLADAIVPRLQICLYDFNLDVCRQAAIALGRLKTAAAAVALFDLLRSPHTPLPLQVDAVRALSWMNTAAAIDYLQQRLALPADEAVIQEIVLVLGRIGSPDLRQTAAAVIHSAIATLSTPTLKQMAALSLGQLSQPQSIELLVNLLADPDVGVRLHAIAALRQIDAETAYQRLQTSTQTDNLPDELRQGIAVALAEW